MFWFHHCTITENVIIHRAIWRTTPSSSFEPDVLFHTPHGGLRPSFRLCVWSLSLLCDMKALLHVPHFNQIWSAGNAMHIFFVLCAPNTPHRPADWYQADSPRNKSFNATTCHSLCLFFRAMDGCRKIWSVSLPTSRWMMVNNVTMCSSNINSAVFHIWDSSRVCGATGLK